MRLRLKDEVRSAKAKEDGQISREGTAGVKALGAQMTRVHSRNHGKSF